MGKSHFRSSSRGTYVRTDLAHAHYKNFLVVLFFAQRDRSAKKAKFCTKISRYTIFTGQESLTLILISTVPWSLPDNGVVL